MLIAASVAPLHKRLRSELQLRRMRLKHTRKEDFAIPISPSIPQFGLTLFRGMCSFYATAWLVLDAINHRDIGVWLTNVSSLAMCLQALFYVTGCMLAEVALFHDLNKFIVLRRSWSESRGLNHSVNTMETSVSYCANLDAASRYAINDSTSTPTRPEEGRRRLSRSMRVPDIGWYRKLFWFIYYAAVDLTLVTSVVSVMSEPGVLTNVHDLKGVTTFHRDFILPLLLLIEVTINTIPIGLLHVIYPLLLSSIYVITSLFHWRYGDERLMIAPELACKHLPCVKHISMILLLGIPIAHLFLYSVHMLKVTIVTYLHRLPVETAEPVLEHRDFPVPQGPLAVIGRISSV